MSILHITLIAVSLYIAYYINSSITVYCTMFNATKAFDRVKYCKLFKLLIERGLPPVIIKLLLNMYIGHFGKNFLKWSSSVKSYLKQGAVISPLLLCLLH